MRQDTIEKYLRRRADLTNRPLVSGPLDCIEQVVVIPALAETAYLFKTLESLAANPPEALRRTLVVCVVNNRAVPHADAADIEDNRETLERLAAVRRGEDSRTNLPLRLAYVDASSPGRELPETDGAGLARKIGLDWGLAVLKDARTPCRLLFSVDADTLVDADYLAAVRAHFEAHKTWAAVVAYAHRFDGSPGEVAGVVCYELFLRYHRLGLAYARSPYAFHAIGSTIVCRAEAYAAVSGMNRRQAGEDFYFAQELAKTGGMDSIRATTVYPSCRASARVPFGTGPRVRRFQEDARDAFAVHHPDSYRILKDWLSVVERRPGDEASELLSKAEAVSVPLRAFLEANAFERVWEGLTKNSHDAAGLVAQFHRWFDGLKTLRLIHYLRDNGLPQQNLFEAIATLLARTGATLPVDLEDGIEHDLERQIALLEHLRAYAS